MVQSMRSKRWLEAWTFAIAGLVPSLSGCGEAEMDAEFRLPAVQAAREAARKQKNIDQMRQIALAVLNYEAARGMLPPNAAPLVTHGNAYGWRVHVLPYLEQQPLYDHLVSIEEALALASGDIALALQQDLDETLAQTPEIYRDARNEVTIEAAWGPGYTNVLGAFGHRGTFAAPTSANGYRQAGWTLSNISDGTSHTIAAVMGAPAKASPWHAPDTWIDIDSPRWLEGLEVDEYDDVDPQTGVSLTDWFYAAYVDGHVQAVGREIDRDLLRSLLVRDDGLFPLSCFPRPEPPVLSCAEPTTGGTTIECLKAQNACIEDCLDGVDGFWYSISGQLDDCVAGCNEDHPACANTEAVEEIRAAYGPAGNVIGGGIEIIGNVFGDLVQCAAGAGAVFYVAAESGTIIVTGADFGDLSISDAQLEDLTDACRQTAANAGIATVAVVAPQATAGVFSLLLTKEIAECVEACVGPDSEACVAQCQEAGANSVALLGFIGLGHLAGKTLPERFMSPEAFGRSFGGCEPPPPRGRPNRSLTPEELATWRHWVDGDSVSLNQYLTDGTLPPGSVLTPETALAEIVTVDGVFVDTPPTVAAIDGFRGDGLWPLPAESPTFVNPRYVPFSIKEMCASKFDVRMFRLEVPTGIKIAEPAGQFEAEFVLPRGCTFQGRMENGQEIWSVVACPGTPPPVTGGGGGAP